MAHQDDEGQLALTAAEIEAYQREDTFASDKQSTPISTPGC